LVDRRSVDRSIVAHGRFSERARKEASELRARRIEAETRQFITIVYRCLGG